MTLSITTIEEREKEIEEEFSLFDDWLDRYQHIIEMGQKTPCMDPAFRTDDFRVKGCQSQVWLQPGFESGLVTFRCDSDAAITKGLAAMLLRILSAQPPRAVIEARLGFLERVGLREHLSPTRSNGLANMVAQMRTYARAFSAREDAT